MTVEIAVVFFVLIVVFGLILRIQSSEINRLEKRCAQLEADIRNERLRVTLMGNTVGVRWIDPHQSGGKWEKV